MFFFLAYLKNKKFDHEKYIAKISCMLCFEMLNDVCNIRDDNYMICNNA